MQTIKVNWCKERENEVALVGCLTAYGEGKYFHHVPHELTLIQEKNPTPGDTHSKDLMCRLKS